MQFNQGDLEVAIGRLGMLSYFPSEPKIQAAIMDLLARMCPHLEALEWLVDQMVNRVGAWKGPTELRGVLCWKYQPADGVEVTCSIAGFMPVDGEVLTIERGFWQDRPQLESVDPECCALVQSIAKRRRLI